MIEATALSSCTVKTCPISSSPYGYHPSLGVNLVFLIGFISSLVGILTISLYTRRWVIFAFPICTACLFEAIGYAVRMGSWNNPWNASLYAVTTIFLTTAPTFITTSLYLVLEHTMIILGKEHSLVNPKWYYYCIGADITSFAVQLIGVSLVIWDVVETHSVGHASDKGGRIVAVGLGVHALMLAAVFIIYIVALARAYISYREIGYTTLVPQRGGYKEFDRRFKVFLGAILVAFCCLLARDLYRMLGFVDGFDGGNRDEARWSLLDGLLVSEAALGLAVLHPSYIFSDYDKRKKYKYTDAVRTVRTLSTTSYGRLVRQAVV